jgi:hypothetical protein
MPQLYARRCRRYQQIDDELVAMGTTITGADQVAGSDATAGVAAALAVGISFDDGAPLKGRSLTQA